MRITVRHLRGLLARVGPAAAIAAALVLVGGALALAAARSGSYTGTTSEHGPVTFSVAAGGHALRSFTAELGYNGKCGGGGGPGLTASIPSMAIAHNGSFSANTRLTFKTFANDPGRVFGKVTGSSASGTVEEFVNGQPNRCYTETFTAHRK